MQKINFINDQAPALNATNLNQMQANTESAINDVSTPTTVINGDSCLKKMGKLVSWYNINSRKYIVVSGLTIPSGYRPPSGLAVPCIYTNTSYTEYPGVIKINTNGSVSVEINGSAKTDGWVCVNASWFIE